MSETTNEHKPLVAPEQCLFDWLQGYTCVYHAKSIRWVSECARFVILKHHGHTEYLGRFSGSTRCGTYYALLDVNLESKRPFRSDPTLKKWEGRWKKEYIVEAEDLACVKFVKYDMNV